MSTTTQGVRTCRCGCGQAARPGAVWASVGGHDAQYLYAWLNEQFGSVAAFADAVERLGWVPPNRRD